MQCKELLLGLLSVFTAVFMSCATYNQRQSNDISPLDYGLNKAKTGVERFEVLYKAHTAALEQGKGVNYSKIKSIDIEIPKGAKSIPLTEKTDFKGAVITVRNNSQDMFLFEYKRTMMPITVNPREVDKRTYSSSALSKGLFLLVIEDKNPWVKNREGYSYGATRKDIVLIENGNGKDGACSTYDNKTSAPVFSYRRVTPVEKSFANLVFVRTPESSKRTKLVKFSYENNVRIENISITTPPGNLYGDEAICVYDCCNVILKDLSINGTYSTKEHFGYGVSMNNVWNVTCCTIKANTEWGVFGTNNTHQVRLEDCDINRFDIHCYGKDVECVNCVFRGTGGIFSSVFGTITYENCTFNDACPYINRPDFNANVGFDLKLIDCVINSSSRKIQIINLRVWNDNINEREELKKKCFPNVFINNLIVNIPKGCEAVELFSLPSKVTYPFPAENLSIIDINGLEFKYDSPNQVASLLLSSAEIKVERRIECKLKGLNLLPKTENAFSQRTHHLDYSGSVSVNLRSMNSERILVSDSRLNYNVTSNSLYDIVFNHCTIGCVRQTLNNSKYSRRYQDCSIYLNSCDKEQYFIDNNAEYDNCLFIPSDPTIEMVIPKSNRIRFNNSTIHPSLKVRRADAKKDVSGLSVLQLNK